MEQPPSLTPAIPPPSWVQIAVAAALAGAVCLCVGRLAGGPWGGASAPYPYVWRDVALVHLIGALPLAWMGAALLQRRLGGPGMVVVVAALIFGLAVYPFLRGAAPRGGVTAGPSLFFGVILRTLPALGMSFAAMLVAGLAGRARGGAALPNGGRHLAVVVGLGVAVLFVLPMTYVGARCRDEAARLADLVDQSRIGEARALANRLILLNSSVTCKGQPIPRLAALLDRVARDLELEVNRPLPANASAAQRFERARQLAVLGRSVAALDLLDSIREPALAAKADNLRGTIHENQGNWEEALEAFQSAGAASPVQSAEQVRATTGIAYCQRKLGRYADAEETYLQLLEASPTAETHFLLAQFYEDSQQAAKARAHARHAMALDPERYRREGEQLINKLTVFHFGCLGVHRAERDAANTSLTPGDSEK